MVDLERPLCEVCNRCLAEKSGRVRSDGSRGYCKRCRGCRHEASSGKRHPYKIDKKYRKPYLEFRKDHCEKCGFKAVHSCQLDVDHIDGNHNNNAIENLQTLCANCHRLKTRESKQDRSLKWRGVA